MAYTAISGRKLQRKLGASLNESASAPTSAFAKRQLEKMGWKEGEGLGARSTGIKTHIRVHKREDEIGIGHEKLAQAEASNMWWSSSMGSTLAKLAAPSSDKKKKKKSSSKKDKKGKKTPKLFYTDQELFEATGGARFGMRAQRRAESKWARAEKSEELAKQEQKAKEMFEWNGLGEAKVLLKKDKDDDKKESKKKRKYELIGDYEEEEKKCEDEPQMNDSLSLSEKELKREKKKQKKRKEEEKGREEGEE